MKLLVLAPTVLSVGVLLVQQPASDVTRNPLATSPTAVADGQQVYNQTCQSCHGSAGQGDRAPALTTTRFVHGNDDADVFHTIRSGIPGTQMPPFGGLSDEQIWQLVTYIRRLQSPAPADRASATATMPTEGNAAAGEALFFGKAACATCHEVNGRGGIAGPDLSGAGRLSPAALRQIIIDPNSGPPDATVVVKTQDGRDIRGVRRDEDTFSVQIVDASRRTSSTNGSWRRCTSENRSLMPAELCHARLSLGRHHRCRRLSSDVARGATCEDDGAADWREASPPTAFATPSRTAELAHVSPGAII